jgi:apolipoprotein N-acyltransferase
VHLQITKSQRYLLSSLSGILLGLSFPYTGSLFPLVFVAFIPVLFVDEYISRRNYRAGKIFVHAYLTFFFYNLISTWWIYHASFGGAVMAVFANALVMALPFYFFHLTKKYVGRKEGYLSLPIYWIGFEYLHFHWDLSWPWLDLGNVFARVPELVQWYSYTGVLGGTFWILVINLLFYRIVQNVYFKKETWRIQTPLFFTIGLFILIPVIISLTQYFSSSEKANSSIEVSVIQPNVDPYNEKFNLSMEEQLDHILTLAEKGKKSDLILAPETSLAYEFYEDEVNQYPFFLSLQDTVKSWKSDFLIGASTRLSFERKNSSASRAFSDGPGFFESYNSSLFISPEKGHRFVHKSKLVLGVEKIPFMQYLPFLDKLAIDLDGASGTLGIEKEPQVIEGEKGLYAPVICYESVYGEFLATQSLKGAQMIAIITNDGWWKDTPGYRQHWSFARLRAVENGKWVARSANTGWSGFINEKGDVIQKSTWWEEDLLTQKVPLISKTTFYSQHGDIFGRSFGFVSLLLLVFMWAKRFRYRFAGGPKGNQKSV